MAPEMKWNRPASLSSDDNRRMSNPFASSPSSPTSPSFSPADVGQTSHPNRFSSVESYVPFELPMPETPTEATNTSPSQATIRNSGPASQLPPLPDSDPEKSDNVQTDGRDHDARDPHEDLEYGHRSSEFPNEFYHEDIVEIKAKCLRLLIYLSGPVFLISILLTIWTVIGLILSLFLHPFNLLRKSKSLREQSIAFLAPPLKIHLSFIFATVRDETYSSYTLPLLILINCLAPLVAIPVAISAWTAAIFWFYAAIIGDPEGTDHETRRTSYIAEKDEDGKDSVVGVRRWWKMYLVRALR